MSGPGEPLPYDPDLAEKHGLRGTVIGLAMAAFYYLFIRLLDWALAGFLLSVFPPRIAVPIHAAIFFAAILGFVARGLWQMRDRFALWASLAIVGAPVAAFVWAWAAHAS